MNITTKCRRHNESCRKLIIKYELCIDGSCWCEFSIFKYCYVSHWFCFIFVQFDLVHGFQIAATYLTHREAQIQTIPQHVCMLGLVRAFYWKKRELMEDNPSNQETEQNGDNLPKKNIQHATALVFVYVAYNLNGKIFHCMWLILFNCGTAECICKSGNTCFHQFLFHNYTPYRWLSAGCLAFTFSMSLSLPPSLSLYIYHRVSFIDSFFFNLHLIAF